MKKYLLLLFIISHTAFGQIKFAITTQYNEVIVGEESLMSYNPLDIANLGYNAGIKSGLRLTFNEFFSTNLKLGVQNLNYPNGNGQAVPVDFSVTTNLNSLLGLNSSNFFLLETGLGYMLTHTNNENQMLLSQEQLTSNLNLGLSYQVSLGNQTAIAFGLNSFKLSDRLSSTLDAKYILNYHTSLVFTLNNKKGNNETNDLSSEYKALTNELIAMSMKYEKELKQKDLEIEIFSGVIDELNQGTIESNSADQAVEEHPIEPTQSDANPLSFAIVIASFSSYESALEYSNELTVMPMILLDSSGKRYRVVEQIVESKDEAIKASNRLKKNNVDNWILTL
jgi:hypothetical protein